MRGKYDELGCREAQRKEAEEAVLPWDVVLLPNTQIGIGVPEIDSIHTISHHILYYTEVCDKGKTLLAKEI